jgi:UPF0716 protein FxsA
MRRRVPWWLLALLFIVLPVVEIFVLIQIGQVIGAWWTILLLIADGILGSWLMKREGTRALRALQQALDARRMPARELADGALILVGGTLLLTPGFVSDIAGLICVLPFTRPLVRGAPVRFLTKRFLAPGSATVAGGLFDPAGPGATRTRQRPGADGVVQGEVID